MANVLGELFSDIAGAIREKTGDVATMKPALFPEKIRGISSGGGGTGGNEEPLIKYVSSITTTTGSPTSSHQISRNLSKETKILAVWAGGQQDKSDYKFGITLSSVPLSELTVDTSNANYNRWSVPYEFYNPFLSGTYKKTIVTKMLVTVPGITVTSRGDGFYDGKLNYVDTYEYPVKSRDMGVYTTLVYKKFTFADGITTAPEYICYDQTYLEDVDLSNITSIGTAAFENCKSLKSINLGPNLSTLGDYAFSGCTSLTGELVIPPKITRLPYYCFEGTKFDRVVFHGNIVFNKADYPFSGCDHPTEYDFSAFTSVPELYSSSYFGLKGKGQVFKIPSALFDTWSTSANWSDWASQMVPV